MSKPKEIITKLTEELNKNASVLAYVLVGSQARETIYQADEYSDVESYIIVKDGVAEEFKKTLPNLVNSLGEIIFSYNNQWAGFSTLFSDLFRLELPIAELNELPNVFTRPIAQEVRVLIDKTNGELEKVLNSRPETIDFEKLFQDRVLDFWYMGVVAAQYYKKGELWNTISALRVIQSDLIKLWELLQDPNILLLESNKRIEKFLSNERISLLKIINPNYDEDQVKKALLEIIEIFPRTAKEVSEKFRYTYNETLEKQVKPKLVELLDGD